MSDQGARARIRTATERKKALAQLQELRSQGKVAKALVIIERTDGDFEVLAQEMRPYEVPRALYVATMAIQQAEAARTATTPEPLQFSVALGGVVNEGDRIRPKVTRGPNGALVPPPGETLISCPVCSHPRYYVLVGTADTPLAGLVARLSCAHCGNEVAFAGDDEER